MTLPVVLHMNGQHIAVFLDHDLLLGKESALSFTQSPASHGASLDRDQGQGECLARQSLCRLLHG